MARGKLWSVKGISPEAREAARMAAQDSGEPIGAWIDQAIQMSDDELSGNGPQVHPAQDDPTALEIVRVLEALEARVASHADHIARQLEPVRDSIEALDRRLARIEAGEKQAPVPPPAIESPEAMSAKDHSLAPEAPTLPDDDSPLDFSSDPAENATPVSAPVDVAESDADETVDINSAGAYPETYADDVYPTEASAEDIPDADEDPEPEHPQWSDLASEESSDDEPGFDEPDLDTPPGSGPGQPIEPVAAPTPTDPPGHQPDISEDNIHAADASLNSELNGLFDDGAHFGRQVRVERPGYDPRFPPPPTRRSSRAPLLFIAIVLLIACAGMGAFAWTQFKDTGIGTSFSLDDVSLDSLVTKLEDIFTPDSFAPEAKEAPAASEQAAPAATPQPEAAAASSPADPATEPTAATATPEPAAPVDPELAVLIKEAAAGDSKAQNELGNRYLVGRGVTQDYAEAARWLQGAAAKGVVSAQYNLGVLYDSGRGVAADPTEALFWFHSAAEKGHGRAQMAMAAAYAAGRGIERNPDEALKWLRAASESNISDAQISLANILASSPENRNSLIDALFWYRVADANGVADAAARGDQVATQLTAEERAGVNRRVSHFMSQKLAPSRVPTATTRGEPAAGSTPEPTASAPSAPAPATAAPSPPPPPPPPAVDAPGTSGDTPLVARVKEIQVLLGRLGFDPGPADGTVGEKTRDAIRSYQKELSLPVDGEPSPELLAHLRKIIGG